MSHSFRRWLPNWLVFVIFAVVIFIWRRPGQFDHPYIWVEEGVITLPDYLRHGWSSLFMPVAGYIVLPAKVIFLAAASLSFAHLPHVEYWLTIMFEVGTLAIVAFSPTGIRMPVLAALAVALLPTDSEVYAVSEFAFWWGTLWAFVAVFWDDRAPARTLWRCVLVGVGGLSSPMALPIAAILALRLAFFRKRADFAVLVVATAAAVAQGYTLSHVGTQGTPSAMAFDVAGILARFVGGFALATPGMSETFAMCLGVAVVLGGAAFFVYRRKWRDPYFVMLLACFAAAVLASISRMPVLGTHPIVAGPRYYFFPFTFLAWMLLYAVPEIARPWKILVTLLFAGALLQFVTYGQRGQDEISWKQELKQCRASGDTAYPLKIQTDGNLANVWHVPLTASDCGELKRRSLFH